MRKTIVLLSITLIAGLTSCELFDSLIPDVDTNYSKTLTVSITQNEGETEAELVDATDSDDYEDFKDNIKGYKVNKITYTVTDANIPSDMYFNGSVKCKAYGGSSFVFAGNISKVNIQSVLGSGEIDVEKLQSEIGQVVKWLKDPAKFYLSATYTLTDDSGSPYPVEGTEGYGFKLKLKFYVTVETGA